MSEDSKEGSIPEEHKKALENMSSKVFGMITQLAEEDYPVVLAPFIVMQTIQAISDALTIPPETILMAVGDLMLESREVDNEGLKEPATEEMRAAAANIFSTNQSEIIAPSTSLLTPEGIPMVAAPTPENYT